MGKKIKAYFVSTTYILDNKTSEPTGEKIDIYRLEGGGLVGIDSSFVETEQPIYSPFDKGLELEIVEN